jgi:hypothetical protein
MSDSEDKIMKAIEALSKKIDNNATELKKKINSINLKLDTTNKNIDTKITEVKNYVDESWSCFKKSHELLMNGIPAIKDEKALTQTFKLLASTLGYSDSNLPDVQIFRMANDISKPIVIRFATIFHKDIFLRKYYINSKLLTLQRLGFSDEKRVYLQPNLSKKNYQIYKLALQHKKLGTIKSVRIIDYGDIAIQLSNGSIARVNEKSDLKNIVQPIYNTKLASGTQSLGSSIPKN